MDENAPRNAHKANASLGSTYPTDAERDALKNAIRASTIYAAIVVSFEDQGDPFESLKAASDFIVGLQLPDSFAGYCIIGPAAPGSLFCRILFKAVGSLTAIPIKITRLNPQVVAAYDDFVEVQEEIVARIDELCEGAVCIGAVGQKGMIPLWIPLTFALSYRNQVVAPEPVASLAGLSF